MIMCGILELEIATLYTCGQINRNVVQKGGGGCIGYAVKNKMSKIYNSSTKVFVNKRPKFFGRHIR